MEGSLVFDLRSLIRFDGSQSTPGLADKKGKDQRPKTKDLRRHVANNHNLNIHLLLPGLDGDLLAGGASAERGD